VGEAFQGRLRNFPSLVTCCTIDWFSEWPAEALRGVANEVPPDASSHERFGRAWRGSCLQ